MVLQVALGNRYDWDLPRLKRHADAAFRSQRHHKFRLDGILGQLEIVAAADQGQ
jgi:hypothetical protein